jgi:hypothetical protein
MRRGVARVRVESERRMVRGIVGNMVNRSVQGWRVRAFGLWVAVRL